MVRKREITIVHLGDTVTDSLALCNAYHDGGWMQGAFGILRNDSKREHCSEPSLPQGYNIQSVHQLQHAGWGSATACGRIFRCRLLQRDILNGHIFPVISVQLGILNLVQILIQLGAVVSLGNRLIHERCDQVAVSRTGKLAAAMCVCWMSGGAGNSPRWP